MLVSIRSILNESLGRLDDLIIGMYADNVTDKLALGYELKREHSRGICCLECRGL